MQRPAHRTLMLALTTSAVTALLATACSSNASTPSTGAPGSAGGATGAAAVQTTSGPLGTYLTDKAGNTLYLFAADTSTTSTCTAACTTFWPPLLTKGAPTGGGQVDASKLGTTARTDGTTQVTYAGHPLYYFKDDAKAGDTNGQGSNGFGARWWVVSPAGAAVASTATPSMSGSTSGGGYGGY